MVVVDGSEIQIQWLILDSEALNGMETETDLGTYTSLNGGKKERYINVF